MSGQDPVAWLRAQVEADLALARRIAARWIAPADHPTRAGEAVWPAPSVEALMVFDGDDPDVNAGLDLIRLCGPAYVIDRCEAELAILDEHRGEMSEWGGHRPDGTWQQRGLVCMTCGHDDGRLGVAWPCRTVRLVAGGYRHRPGYEEAGWKHA